MVAVSSVLLAGLVPLLAVAQPIQNNDSHGDLAARGGVDGGANTGLRSARAHIRSDGQYRRDGKGKCKPRPAPASPPSPPNNGGADQAPSSSSKAPSAPSSAAPPAGTPTTPPAAPPTKPEDGQNEGNSNGGGGGGSLTAANDGKCGPNGVTADLPNGSEEWINCGLNSGGWTPPDVKLEQLKSVPLDAGGVFKPCEPYFNKFNSIAAQYNIPPIMIASFALQESTCNPEAVGGGHEQGMMQLGDANCAGAPGGNCRDVDFNIGQGAKYFHDKLQENGGNVFLAIGTYNGWYQGLTTEKATQADKEGRCFEQNNLDYVFQMVNGWMLGKDGHTIGTIRNTEHCK